MLPLLFFGRAASVAEAHMAPSSGSLVSAFMDRAEPLRDAFAKEEIPGPVMTTALVMLAGAGLVKGKKAGCRRRKGHAKVQDAEVKEVVSHGSEDLENAELCWSRQYGRFKYTGLRDEPFAPNAPKPAYSLLPLDLKLPTITSKEEESLSILEGKVSDLAQTGVRVDRATLLRYLRAGKGKVNQAETIFRRAAKWRKDNDVNRCFSHWDLEALEDCLAPWWPSGGFCGRSLQGHPVYFERLGHCSWPRICADLPFEILQKLDLVHCMRCLGAVEEDALHRGVPITGIVMVIDLHGFGIDQAQLRAAWLLAKLADARAILLPETVNSILMIRAPSAFAYAWSSFSHLMDPRTREKVQIANAKDTHKLLLRYISEENIPSYLGGKLCIEGDVECRKLLAPGGYPPVAARQRLMQLMKASGGLSRAYRETKDSASVSSEQADDADEWTGRGSSFCGVCFG